MLTIKKLHWDNVFSYGSNNSIEFTNNKLIQLIGKNGHGKSSIALILEEALYNKNSKNVKKSDIINRNINTNAYKIKVEFSKHDKNYEVIVNRNSSTQSIKLLENGKDISQHTSTNTYKQLEKILGFDHKKFTQIIYQSSAFNLEFLTSTDTNRKKFLIDLLELNEYNVISNKIKEKLTELNYKSGGIKAAIASIENFKEKIKNEDLTKKELKPVPLKLSRIKIDELQSQIFNIDKINKSINDNNKYKQLLHSLDITECQQADLQIIKELNDRISVIKSDIGRLNKDILNLGNLKTVCDACGQPIDTENKIRIKKELEDKTQKLKEDLNQLTLHLSNEEDKKHKYEVYQKNKSNWETYYNLIDKNLQEELLDKYSLEIQLKTAKLEYNSNELLIQEVTEHNTSVIQHNAKIDMILGQLVSVQEEFNKLTGELSSINSRISNLDILNKAFSTSGLVAYKIECMVKDLETFTNEYLNELSDGRFQLYFKISASDKLNVVITDNGLDIDILALSNGERARVNMCALLAIRKLLQIISSDKINLLILDETIESLDIEGKEKLIELLLKIDGLNTVLISHGFSHPLLEKIYVNKVNDISTLS